MDRPFAFSGNRYQSWLRSSTGSVALDTILLCSDGELRLWRELCVCHGHAGSSVNTLRPRVCLTELSTCPTHSPPLSLPTTYTQQNWDKSLNFSHANFMAFKEYGHTFPCNAKSNISGVNKEIIPSNFKQGWLKDIFTPALATCQGLNDLSEPTKSLVLNALK